MNNLKRVFSLALTGVMLSGMMVMGASATDFKDDEKIVNQEAVDSCVALSIINGRDNGEYDPEGLVTRAEMAKMIATAVNGGIAPEFGVKATPTFTDIKGIWAEQYIEYCSDMKYIAGRGDGTFDPFGNVTGVEAAKMVLTALGYDATAYQLVGADWTTNVNFQATRNCKPSLYEDLNGVNMNAAITRDTAAQMIWNGVQNYIVEFTPDREVTGTGLSYSYTKSTTTTLLKQAYDGNITVATFDGNKNVVSSLKDDQIQVTTTSSSDPNAVAGTAGAKAITADLDIKYIGESVKVIWKNEKNTPSGLDAKDKIYGVYPTGETEVILATLGDIGSNKASTGEAKIKIDGTKYDVNDPVDVYTNYTGKLTYDSTPTTANQDIDNNSSSQNSDLVDDLKKANGDTMKCILDDGKITRIYVVENKLGVVTAKTSDKVTISGLGTIKIADNEVYEGIAKNDIVTYTRLYDNSDASKAFVTVEKAEKVSGTVKGFKGSENVNLDGTVYKIHNETTLFSNGMPSGKITAFDSSNIGEDVDLYVVNGYVMGAVQTSESANNYSLVIDVKANGSTSSAFTNLQLQVLAADGTKSVITVSDDSTKKTANDYAVGDIVTYTTNKSGEAVVKIEKDYSVDAQTNTGTYNKDTKTISVTSGSSYVTTGDCVLFACTDKSGGTAGTMDVGDTFKAYKIRDLKDLDTDDLAANKWTLVTDDGKAVAAFVELGSTPAGATAEVQYGIVTADNGTVKIDNVAYNSYKFWNGTEEIDVNIKDNTTANATDDVLSKGAIYGFVRANDDTYSDNTGFWTISTSVASEGGTDAKALDGTNFTAMAVLVDEHDTADEILTYFTAKGSKVDDAYTAPTGQATKAVDKDVKIIYVNVDKDSAGDDQGVLGYNPATGYCNAYIIYETAKADVVTTIIVETSGEDNVWKV